MYYGNFINPKVCRQLNISNNIKCSKNFITNIKAQELRWRSLRSTKFDHDWTVTKVN